MKGFVHSQTLTVASLKFGKKRRTLIPHIITDAIYLYMLILTLIHVSKIGPCVQTWLVWQEWKFMCTDVMYGVDCFSHAPILLSDWQICPETWRNTCRNSVTLELSGFLQGNSGYIWMSFNSFVNEITLIFRCLNIYGLVKIYRGIIHWYFLVWFVSLF